MIRQVMHAWERNLSRRDKNRSTLPFDWGLSFVGARFIAPTGEGVINDAATKDHEKEAMFRFNEKAIDFSDDFFRPRESVSFEVRDERLYFPSPVESPYAVNNTAVCRIFEPKKKKRAAVIVLPQWNADANGHVGLCRLLSRLGFYVLRLTMPYHEQRNPNPPRADYMVSPNIGRTIQAIRQAAQDAGRAADWLQLQGFRKLGIMGTSVGSCISFLTFVHDSRFQVGVFNHVSSYFGDVVWKGISTQHVRKGIEGFLSREELRKAWSVISPNSYVARMANDERNYLLISAAYDLTFPPDLSHLLFEAHAKHGVSYDRATLPCGHYSSALTPFKHLDGYLIARYFLKHLK
jgi:dienelactone hydrolase